MFSLSFVLQSKDFIVFLQKNQTTYQMKRNKKTFYTLLYIVGFISIWLMPLQAFGSIKLDGKRLSAKQVAAKKSGYLPMLQFAKSRPHKGTKHFNGATT